ncbi:T9SS sorting signal type C domain-containing protein [Lacinutrix sp. C3R15]|uniref:T9SS sorting signal type C domain-containing protein n=1 Tax=Flavobacteriaceae TaxID=49546 RepID=UPI001C0903EB|nr:MULTISPECIES: T9SS sorting signal type C domain-containing protein [Flavobacteriaceae]MBU2940931.1 T9SS sorting signal type C domain-containing protein [Lacinutrix sp. C3R15]MDO6624250.1 T9SS sorting signal type C domain-containing protein [Oceanihabitans sp. 1_MG-2023]
MTKNYALSLLAFLCAIVSGFAQTTIAIQDFETSPATPTMTYTGGSIATGTGPYPSGDNNFVSGSQAIEESNGTSTITFSNVDASAYTNVYFTCRLASFSGTTGNGADGADGVYVYISNDGGTTWLSQLEVQGNSNARWSFDTGTGTASTTYDNNNSPTVFTPGGGGYRTTDGYSTIVIDGLPNVNNLRVRLVMNNNSSSEYWIVDDAEIIGTIAGPNITATPTTITDLDYAFGAGPSASQSFDVTGTLLTAGIDITAPTNFEIATTETGPYSNTVNISALNANSSNTIYVRLKTGLASTTYSGTITMTNATSGIASTPTVEVSGEVLPPPPTNDDCSGAIDLTPSSGTCTYTTYSNENATDSSSETAPGCANYQGGDVWFSVVVPATGEITIDTNDIGFSDSGMALYSGSCGSLTLIECNDDGSINGAMSSITRNDLTPGTTVYIRVWEYAGNDSGDFGICVTTPTPCVAPTTQPTSLSLSNITSSSIDGSFTATTADDYLVVVSTSATLGANPVDGTSYTTGDSIGSGTVVQSSNATTFTATGLSQTTQYYFFVFALNDSSCAGGPTYNTTMPLTGSESTVSGPCLEEDFESGLPGSYQTNSWTLASGTWSGANVYGGNNPHTGSKSCQMKSTSGANIISPDLGSVQTVNFWARGSTNSSIIQVNYSTDGGTSWTAAPESPYSLTTSHNQFTATINTTSNTIIQFYRTEGTIYLDDVEIYCGTPCTTPADPTGTISGATPICAASTSLSFSGTAPTDVAYYWQTTSLGEDLSNDASSNLTVTTSGDYYVRAYNTVGGCWSDGEVGPYTVSVTTATPTINSHPSDTSAGIGGNASFVVSSPNASSYQWQVSTNGGTTWTNTGTDSNSLTLTNVQLTEDGNLYQVIVTNACGNTTSNTATLTVTTSTIFNPGELIFVGYDGQINGNGSEDEFLIATLVDITTGTEFSLVNSRFEAGAAANARTNKWGGGSNDASQAPFETKITYTGSTVIPAGSVLQFEVTNTDAFIIYATVTEGTTTTTRTSDFNFNVVNPGLHANISTSGSDQLYLMQGDFVSDGSIDANEANYIFNGTLLHGITIDTPWVSLSSACSGGSTDANRVSRLPAELRCFNVESEYDIRGYYENDKEHGVATIRTIVNNVSDYSGNWNIGSYSFDPTTTTASDGGRTFSISPSNPAGQWVGDVDTNWFNCANWESLAVPKPTTDVIVDNSAINNAVIDHTASYADEVNEIAYANNLTIAGNAVEISGSINNVLEVHGDLLIDTPGGVLDMNDNDNTNADGYIKLYGDWTTNIGTTGFDEGNGTVEFAGTTPQIITNTQTPIPPNIPEEFYNVILSNNFNTNVSNDLYMHGSLTINSGNTLTVTDNRYVYVNLDVTNNGIFNIENNGSLVQGDDSGTNTGNISMQRTASIRKMDYVYWSSPVAGFNTNNISPASPTSRIYSWNPTITNSNGSQGNWISAANTTMTPGVGYIVRGPNSFSTTAADYTATFNNGVPLNGIITSSVSRGSNPAGYDTNDDDWNLLGNPYPSAINAIDFLTLNTNLEGYINIWTHGTLPNASITDPYYYDFAANYDENDYLTYNSAGSSAGPSTFNGDIAAAQSFMVNMVDGAAASETVTFNNSLRDISLNNSEFYRTANTEKHRIWLDLVPEDQPARRILVGYVENATMQVDRMYDAQSELDSNKNFYSVISNEAYKIQGRALPFVDTDVIPLGINATSASNYTIALFAVDGLFENSEQNIYLKDNTLGHIHHLNNAPYTFALDAGTHNNRFEIVFNNNSLSIEENQYNNSLTIVEQQDGSVEFSTAKDLQIKNVKIYDVLGRLLYNLNGNNSTENYMLNNLSQATYVAKVTLSNNTVITKKAVKRK